MERNLLFTGTAENAAGPRGVAIRPFSASLRKAGRGRGAARSAAAAAACAGLGAYLSGTCAVRLPGTPVIVPNKSLYITADSEDSLHLESSDPDFIELRVSDRNTHLDGGNCASCLKRIEWYIQKNSREERFFDKLFATNSFSRYSIQIAASGQTP